MRVDRHCAAVEAQRLRRWTCLALRVDPHRAPRPVEEPRGVARREGAVATMFTRHPERADEPEEPEPLEVLAGHHRERLEPEHVRTDEHGDERIPPCGVIRDPERRVLARGRPDLVEAVHHHGRERAADPCRRAACEPSREPWPARARDHPATHASTSDAASGIVAVDDDEAGARRDHRARSSNTSLRAVDVDARAPIESQPRRRMTLPMSA